MTQLWHLPPDRYLDPVPEVRKLALDIYEEITGLPLVCPHGHVDPALFAAQNADFGTPPELLVCPDHYVLRMLYSQGVSLASLGIESRQGSVSERDSRRIWQTFADHFYLFRGTPTGMWLSHELKFILGIEEGLQGSNAQSVYDQINEKLGQPDFRPRALFEKFNIEVLSTTNSASDLLESHTAIQESGWGGRVIPTFRPDSVVAIDGSDWVQEIEILSDVSGIQINSYQTYIQALEQRRSYFKMMGAVSTDHGVYRPLTLDLTPLDCEDIFQSALRGEATPQDAERFSAHMLVEMARMSVEDGLVMQIHPGVLRNHDISLYHQFGPDMGGDIPVPVEFTEHLRTLLNRFGHNPRLTLIIFTIDESTYARELAPLAGYYPALKLGPPWWFNDSWNGMQRYFDSIFETAGIYNTVGFNDDTRAFLSIPARHDLWRRASANWLAGLAARSIISEHDAFQMASELAYNLAKRAYNL